MGKKSGDKFILGIVLVVIGLAILITDKFITKNYGPVSKPARIPPAGKFIQAEAPFRFYLLGDSAGNDLSFNTILKKAKSDPKARFIIHTGDIAKEINQCHFEFLLDIIEHRLGDFPFYIVPGNHDITTQKKHRLRIKNYNRAFGPEYYWFGYANTLFIMLDTSISSIQPEQVKWLEDTLKRIRPIYKTCIVVMHVPPIDPRNGKNYGLYTGADVLGRIFRKYDVNTIFAGHIHDYISTDFQGIPLYINPSAGQRIRSKDPHYGYLVCDVDKNGNISVEKRNATDKKNRDYAAYFFILSYPKLRIHLIGITTATLGLILLILAWIRRNRKID